MPRQRYGKVPVASNLNPFLKFWGKRKAARNYEPKEN